MKKIIFAFLALGVAAFAAGALEGEVEKQPLNISAIIMFLVFVSGTLGITYWAAKRTKTAKDFYTAGGGITGLQNGLAIAGDYMSAASFLGISGLVYAAGYDGLIYSIGFLVGWPVILFLVSDRLRNLGKYTFADVAAYRLKQGPIRTLAAFGSIATVILYLIAQMVGAGALIQILFGLPYEFAVIIVGGNIDHLTRVMTTAIALETSKGDLALALALGIVLVTIARYVKALVRALRLTATRYA